MNLSILPIGQPGRIAAVAVEPGFALRLGELGLRVGADVQVVHHTRAGCLIAVGTDRVALDHRSCANVSITTS